LPYIEVRFSNVPRTSVGLVFGKDPSTSDILLPPLPGISRSHFALTYKNTFVDGCYRVVVRDLGSTRGAAVSYDRKGDHVRSKFDWIVSGFDPPSRTEVLIIQPNKAPQFRLVVAHHDITSPIYISNVEQFRRGAVAAEDLLGGLGLQSGLETERTTGAHTPVDKPVLIPQGWIAQGGFGVVSRHWNVSTGEEYACKQPIGTDYDRRAWEKEIGIMKQISHVVGHTPIYLLFLL
jgi:serine/threonine-protein kinase Chk2